MKKCIYKFLFVLFLFLFVFNINNVFAGEINPNDLNDTTGRPMSFPARPDNLNSWHIVRTNTDDYYYISTNRGDGAFGQWWGNTTIIFYDVNRAYHLENDSWVQVAYNTSSGGGRWSIENSVNKSYFKHIKGNKTLRWADNGSVPVAYNEFSLFASNSDLTTEPIILYTNWFNYNDLNRWNISVTDSQDFENATNWKPLQYITKNHADGSCEFICAVRVYQNCDLYFKYEYIPGSNVDEKETTYKSFSVRNINTETELRYAFSTDFSSNPNEHTNTGYNGAEIPIPKVTYRRITNADETKSFIFKTQGFYYDRFVQLDCYYTDNESILTDYSQWNLMDLGTSNNSILDTFEYYFTMIQPADREDTTFYFVFYDKEKQEFGSPSSIQCIFDSMNYYADNGSLYGYGEEEQQEKEEEGSIFNELILFWKERLGFFTFPFEFMTNLVNRIRIAFNSVTSELQPIVTIPELKEPFFNNKILDETQFNFNSLLSIPIFQTLYGLYRVAVIFCLICFMINFQVFMFSQVIDGAPLIVGWFNKK